MFERSAAPLLAALLCFAVAGCGLINGLQGNGGEPNGNSTPLSQLQWQGPEMIDHGLPPNSSAPVLVWGQGAAWVAFWSVDYNGDDVSTSWVTRRPRGGEFATPVALPTPSGWNGGNSYPQLAVGDSGDAVVGLTSLQIMSNGAITDSSVWAGTVGADLSLPAGGLTRIDTDNSSQESRLGALAVDAAGDALITWELQLNGIGSYVRVLPAGGGWSPPQQINNAFESSLALAAGSTGNLLLGESEGITDGGSFSATSTVEPISIASGVASFGSPINFPISASGGQYTYVAMRGDQGMVVSAFEGSQTITTDAYSGGFWSAEQTITDSHASVYVEPAIAVNAKGEAVLLWQDYTQATTDIDNYGGTLQASYWDGGSWSPQEQLSLASPSPHAWWGAVGINDQGEAVAAWADFESTGTYTRIFADVLETSSGAPVWSGAVPIDNPSPNAGLDAGLAGDPANVRYVGVALDPAGGDAQVVWIGYATTDATEPRVWSNRLETQ